MTRAIEALKKIAENQIEYRYEEKSGALQLRMVNDREFPAIKYRYDVKQLQKEDLIQKLDRHQSDWTMILASPSGLQEYNHLVDMKLIVRQKYQKNARVIDSKGNVFLVVNDSGHHRIEVMSVNTKTLYNMPVTELLGYEQDHLERV